MLTLLIPDIFGFKPFLKLVGISSQISNCQLISFKIFNSGATTNFESTYSDVNTPNSPSVLTANSSLSPTDILFFILCIVMLFHVDEPSYFVFPYLLTILYKIVSSTFPESFKSVSTLNLIESLKRFKGIIELLLLKLLERADVTSIISGCFARAITTTFPSNKFSLTTFSGKPFAFTVTLFPSNIISLNSNLPLKSVIDVWEPIVTSAPAIGFHAPLSLL